MIRKIAMIAAFTFCGYTFAQSTTQQEFLYMTKGLKTQIESGLDMKNGYELKGIREVEQENYIFYFQALLRKEKKDKVAGVVVIAKNKITSELSFKAIPVVNEDKNEKEVFKAYTKLFAENSNWNNDINKEYVVAASMVLGHSVNHVLKESTKKTE